ncbi:S49 family peptidase [Aeromonas hydrophila]|uniref:S49 family peptidase n=1 Tax=Aeromonas hydrophila TaxID=644 RepID=UPI001FF654D6|nr:S49 family peptidase [Aeromonas hydrophila]MCK0187862.1 S49 family peptidase [Aeromonas hydrophila]UOV94542.1 S49 family peptidase [Aeromonas hydrophila]
MKHNLPGIMSRLFNTPLMIRPTEAQIIITAVSEQMGVGSLLDASSGKVIDLSGQVEQSAESFSERGARSRSYALVDGIAVLPISGTLAHKWGGLQPSCGVTGYDGIQARMNQALADPEVRGILLDTDTGGGGVAGAFDCTDIIARANKIKPVWSLCYDMHCSAGQLLVSGAGRRLITQTGIAGSIGVVIAHMDVSEMLKQTGRKVTLIHAGANKVDGNPYEALPESVRAKLQADVEATRLRFANTVSRHTGLSVDRILAQEAGTFEGQAAIEQGLADELVNGADAVAVMAERISHKQTFATGRNMNVTDKNASTEGADPKVATTELNKPTASALVASAPVVDGEQLAAAENARIMGILDLPEAKGREAAAKELAKNPAMTVEGAKAVLAAIPQTAQAASETALDKLMEGSPAPVKAGEEAQKDRSARLTKWKKD